MAFHVGCPITCRRICFCSLGFPRALQGEKARNEFLDEVAGVEEFLKDPWLLRARGKDTVQVLVPKVSPPPVPPAAAVPGDVGGGMANGDAEEMLSAQTKRAAMQRKAAAASLVAEDYARRFESGALADASGDVPGEDQGQSNVKVMCRLCYSGENEGSERARKMLPCKSCGKKYHRSCLKTWAQHRDLFHWSSWTCPSCRICEVCRRTADQTKFMFCKRCDGAYHCYCQQPPHKNVSSGPYLCPKHTRCHSCGSTVPGNGLSVRWFLGYTCCDACGRLFVKGNYCPVCLKVYRDSESTPMVCCDVCQRWVHCQCDGISDEKYLQFQVDGNLQYKCATCRGECYQVRDLEDAVQELWRRRDKAECDLIASLRAAAGLPTQEEIFSISPYSDDEDSGPVVLKNEYGRSLKFSLKGLVDKSPKKSKEYGKKSSNKKNVKKKVYHSSLPNKSEVHESFDGHTDAPSYGYSGVDNKNDGLSSHRGGEPFSSPLAGSLSEGICSINQAGVVKHKFIDEVIVGNENMKSRVVQIKNSKPHSLGTANYTGKDSSKSKTTNTKGPKLVIHLGGRSRNITNSPRSDASSHQREHELTASNGSEDIGQEQMVNMQVLERNAKLADAKVDKVHSHDQLEGPNLRGKEAKLLKIRRRNSEVSDLNPKSGGNMADGYEPVSSVSPHTSLEKRSVEEITAVQTATEAPAMRTEKVFSRRNVEARPGASTGGITNEGTLSPSGSRSLARDSKPLLKLKFKNPYHETPSTWTSLREDERSSVKGQRSKRKRPSPFMEKISTREDANTSQIYEDNTMNEIMDANWILQKLGKDAIGKRVEVHQPSDNSWHKGVVKDIMEGKSIVSVALDDGRAKNFELGKQGIRFVSKKQKL
ncbi:Histone-lysine N-methyltransferase [Bertholletia excelsa]